jgi:hypothetical protein
MSELKQKYQINQEKRSKVTPLRWSNLAPFLISLQKRADFRVAVTLTITTNTLSDWYVEPEHATLISTISSLASQGLTMKAIADSLNAQGFKSHSGRAFYSELVGALISKYRKKAKSRYVEKTISVVNLDGGWV